LVYSRESSHNGEYVEGVATHVHHETEHGYLLKAAGGLGEDGCLALVEREVLLAGGVGLRKRDFDGING